MKKNRFLSAVPLIIILLMASSGEDAASAGRGRSARDKPMSGIFVNGLHHNGVFLAGKRRTTASVQRVRIEGTQIKVRKADGSWATNEELIGAVLVAVGENGIKESFRIDSVEVYSSDLTGEILLYTFSVKDRATGRWRNLCKPDRKGRQKGFPLSGYWNEKGDHIRSDTDYSITCTGGTIGKCVMMGYLPWGKTRDGISLWEYHQACTRLLRADYCGNGRSHTREGTKIEVYDREDIQVDTSEPGLIFEAAWSATGAECVRRTRIPDLATMEDILIECPEKLRNRTGPEKCLESFNDPRVLILNRSP